MLHILYSQGYYIHLQSHCIVYHLNIYLFDEVAADFDPIFRRYFYEELLPDIIKQGGTILAISHDDRYFHVADRVLTMREGGFVEEPADQGIPA